VVVTVVLALLTAAAYGIDGHFGAMAARRLGAVGTTILAYASGAAVLGVIVIVVGGQWSGPAVGWGVVAAVTATAGSIAFYAAAVSGSVSLVAPLVGVLQTAVPVAVAVGRGERFGGFGWVAVLLAICAAVLASSRRAEGHPRLTQRSGVLTVVSGLLLGASILAVDAAPVAAEQIPVFLELTFGVAMLRMFLLARARRVRVRAAREPVIADGTARRVAIIQALVAGVLLGVANVFLVLALHRGPLAVVGVLVNLYPVFTVVAAWLLDRQRLAAPQLAGVALAVIASVLFGVA
jgi:drug/metabolite transporter (DMT)-like permease